MPPSLQAAQQRAGELGQKMSARARVWRVGIVLLGAGAIAWLTQRAGLELRASLCFFLGALPILWVGGWLFGFLFTFAVHARRARGRGVQVRVGSLGWQQELESVTFTERVKLSPHERGLDCVRDGAHQLITWDRVRVERPDATTLALFLQEPGGLALNEALPVPRAAFASDEAFDAFCLEVQRHVWEAQRRGP